MIEKIKFTFADGPNILGYYTTAIYWTKHFGRSDVEQVFKGLSADYNESYFKKIVEAKKENDWIYVQEHFILRRIADGQYTIEDRNPTPLTYLNNQLVGKRPIPINAGDVITIPLVKNGQDQACYIQIGFDRKEPKQPPMKQLVMCQNTKNYFIVYWEEDPESRHHVSVKIEPFLGDPKQMKSQGYQNLRMGGETPCPHCGNKHLVFCPPCNAFICYDGKMDKIKCPGCKKKYRLKNMAGNIDFEAF